MFLEDDSLVLSPAERQAASVLVVEPDPNSRNNLRATIKSLGYGGISDAPNHVSAFDRLNERRFTHILFDAKKTNMTSREFLQKVLEGDPNIVCVPTSNEPRVDDVFDLFVVGARGFLVKPFTTDTVDEAIISATKGEQIADAVLQAKDRNEALVALLMSALDKVATLLRQGQQFETALREVPKAMKGLARAADLAKTFCKGSNDDLLEVIQNFCVDRSAGPATRLGRLRKKLKTARVDDEPATPAR